MKINFATNPPWTLSPATQAALDSLRADIASHGGQHDSETRVGLTRELSLRNRIDSILDSIDAEHGPAIAAAQATAEKPDADAAAQDAHHNHRQWSTAGSRSANVRDRERCEAKLGSFGGPIMADASSPAPAAA